MNNKYLISAIFTGAALLLAPLAGHAFEVDLDSLTADDVDAISDVTDISDLIGGDSPDGINEVLKGYSYTTALGTKEYVAKFTVNDAEDELDYTPFVLGMGANISEFNYDELAEQFTITFTTASFYIPGDEDPSSEFIFAFIETAADPSQDNPEPAMGPPASMGGGYISTSVNMFEIIPPAGPEDFGFGISLTGTKGTAGFFHMNMPSTMLDLMSTMEGQTITADNLAVYIDDAQASLNVTETATGGALIDINIVFTDNSTVANLRNTLAANTVIKEIVAKEQLPLSGALKKTTVKKGDTARFYGWHSSGKKGKLIKIYQKKKGQKRLKLVATRKTKKNGYYFYSFKTKKTGIYYLKAKNNKNNSPRQTLQVN